MFIVANQYISKFKYNVIILSMFILFFFTIKYYMLIILFKNRYISYI